MADGTKIEWADSSWNPVRGCTRVSPGCGGSNHEGGCYAEKVAARFSGPGQPYHGFAERTPHGGRWTGKLALIESQLDLPLRWRKPRRIFVNSMSDLFHENLPDADIDRVFAVMALCPQHQFLVLTKRAARMRRYFDVPGSNDAAVHQRVLTAAYDLLSDNRAEEEAARLRDLCESSGSPLPLPNVWLGVSVEDQQRADERIPELLATPAAVRFLSCEPLLGPLDISPWIDPAIEHPLIYDPRVNWAIIGGESGPRSRPFNIGWAASLIEQCRAAGTACFVKQLGAVPIADRQPQFHAALGRDYQIYLKDKKGGDWSEWPLHLRVREFPA